MLLDFEAPEVPPVTAEPSDGEPWWHLALDDRFDLDFQDLGDRLSDELEDLRDAILHEGHFHFLCDGDDGEIFDDPGLMDDAVYVVDIGAAAASPSIANQAPQNVLSLFR